MPDMNYIAIATAAVVALAVSGVWYSIFGHVLAKPKREPSAAVQAGAELVRNAVVAFVLALLFAEIGDVSWPNAT